MLIIICLDVGISLELLLKGLKEMFERIIKDPRLWMLLLVYPAGLMTFVKGKDSALIEWFGEDAYRNLYDIYTHWEIWSVLALLVLPILIVLCVCFLGKKIVPKTIYIVGSILGAAATVLVMIMGGHEFGEYIDPVPVAPGFGFFAIMALWIAILVWTLVKDFSISKESIKDQGVQGTILNIKRQMSDK